MFCAVLKCCKSICQQKMQTSLGTEKQHCKMVNRLLRKSKNKHTHFETNVFPCLDYSTTNSLELQLQRDTLLSAVIQRDSICAMVSSPDFDERAAPCKYITALVFVSLSTEPQSLDDGCVPWVTQVLQQVLHRTLSSQVWLHQKAQKC